MQFLKGLLCAFIICIIIINRLRTRETLDLFNGLPIGIKILLFGSLIVLTVILSSKIFQLYIQKEKKQRDSKIIKYFRNFSGDLSFIIKRLKRKLGFRVIIQKEKRDSKIIKYFRNFSEYLSKFIIRLKRKFGFRVEINIFDSILLDFFEIIENTRLVYPFEMIFNLLIVKHFNLFFLLNSREKKVQEILNTPYLKFIYNNIYYIFRFVPIILVHSVGVYEIIFKYKLDLYYFVMPLLLIPFIIQLILKQQMVSNYKKIAAMPFFKIYYTYSNKNTTEIYNVTDCMYSLPGNISEKARQQKPELILQTQWFTTYAIKSRISFELYTLFSAGYPKSDLFLLSFSLIFILLLLFY